MSKAPIPFLGREQELTFLRDRVSRPGLTVVEGPPQIGKTWLLKRLANQLRETNTARVGIADARGIEGEVFIRAAANAYENWLSDADAVAQLHAVWEQQKDGLVGRVAIAFGQIFARGAEALPGGKVIGETINQTFEALVQADDVLKTGGVRMIPIQSDEARSLISFIAHGRTHPVVLVLDQWEGSAKLQQDAAMLERFLGEIAVWPPVHILLHMQHPREANTGNRAAEQLSDHLIAASDPNAKKITIKRIDFAANLELKDELFDYLRTNIAGVAKMDENEVLELIAGNPAVLDRWSNLSTTEQADPHVLHDYARRAHRYQYPEIKKCLIDLLPALGEPAPPALLVALRLAIIPPPNEPESCRAVKEAVLVGCEESVLQGFVSVGFLQEIDPWPSFGLPERQEVARGLALQDPKLLSYTRSALELLVHELVDHLDVDAMVLRGDRSASQRTSLLAVLGTWMGHVNTSALTQRLAAAARWVHGPFEIQRLLGQGTGAQLNSPQARLVSLALVNAIGTVGADAASADQLLCELRALSAAHADDSVFLLQVAEGLVNAIAHSGADVARADRLLGELSNLAMQHHEPTEVRPRLAKGFVNALNIAVANTTRADRLLGELGALVTAHPDDAGVRLELAKAFFNAFVHAIEDTPRADAFLGELDSLAAAHPDDAEVGLRLSRGLVNAISIAGANAARSNHWLGCLRAIASSHAKDAQVQLALADGLLNARNNVGRDAARADALLGELRALAAAHAEHTGMWDALLQVLGISAMDAIQPDQAAAHILEAAGAVSNCSPGETLKGKVITLVGIAQTRLKDAATDAQREAIDRAAAALWAAYRSKWPASD